MKRRFGLIQLLWLLLPILMAVVFSLAPRAADLDEKLSRARTALEEGNSAAASEYLGEILARQPWRTSLWETAGRTALTAGDVSLAVERLRKAEAADAITGEGYLALGDALRVEGDIENAIRNWNLALENGSAPMPVYYRLLEVHKSRGDYLAAIDDLNALIELDPQNAANLYQLGLTLAAREPQSALSVLLEASTLDSDLQNAVKLLEQSLEAPADIDDPAITYFNAGRALASLGEWPLAAEAFRQAILANTGYAEAWAFLGEAMFQIGQDGSEMMETALNVDPDSLTANLLRAIQVRRAGEPALALTYLERAAVTAPEAPAVTAEIAQTYAAMGKVNEALDYFVRAAELAGDDPAYLHLIAMYSIDNELQIDEIGLPAARAAVLRNPEDPIALDLIGYAYYLQGDWVSGLRFLHRSLNSNPNYAPARLHLGMLYLLQEKEAEALTQLQLVIQLAPLSGAAQQAQNILDIYFP